MLTQARKPGLWARIRSWWLQKRVERALGKLRSGWSRTVTGRFVDRPNFHLVRALERKRMFTPAAGKPAQFSNFVLQCGAADTHMAEMLAAHRRAGATIVGDEIIMILPDSPMNEKHTKELMLTVTKMREAMDKRVGIPKDMLLKYLEAGNKAVDYARKLEEENDTVK